MIGEGITYLDHYLQVRDKLKSAFLNVAIRDILRAVEVDAGDKSGKRRSPN
jgi:hypothetical protein